jgi:hypothetical protein
VTTHIARVLERYTIPLEQPDEEHEEWFMDWVLRSPAQAGRHLTAGWMTYSAVARFYKPGDIVTAHESFGGMGAQSLMIQDLFAPQEHSVGEYAPDAVAHLEKLLAPCDGVGVHQWDAYADPPPYAELYGLDFGDLTAWKTRDGQPHRKLLDAVFAFEPKAVVFTDIACRYLHLHTHRYESLLGEGTCGSYGTYLRALLARLEVLYGYSLLAGYWDRWSTVMALVPSDLMQNRGALQETPDSPIGLQLL